MLSRRQACQSAGALVAPLLLPGGVLARSSTQRVTIRDARWPSVAAEVELTDAPAAVLRGVPEALLAGPSHGGSPVLRIRVSRSEAELELVDDRARCVIRLEGEADGFLASWALPVCTHGLFGYAPSLDLPSLFARGRGVYRRLAGDELLRAASVLPTGAGAAYACLIGDWQTLQQMAGSLDAVGAALPDGADFIFTSALDPRGEPAMLLTTFAP
jgi:hypothetical protein